jgi:hypothetical protein
VAANPGVNLDALRPYKGYNSIRESDNVATSRYNSLQLSWNRRFANSVAFGAAYTLSQSMDDGSAQRDIIPNTYNAHNLWGQSVFDVRHILVVNWLYELPIFRGQHNMAAKMLGGWQFSGIAQFQTGTACSVVSNNDYAGVGVDGNWDSCGGTGNFWVMNGNPAVLGQFSPNGAGDSTQWFATKNPDGSPIFTAPAKGTFNQQSGIRNFYHNPGLYNFNFGLFKKFAITETKGLQFRAEAFNVFNHPNLSAASVNPTSSTFGKSTGKTNDVRNMQLSLRFYF